MNLFALAISLSLCLNTYSQDSHSVKFYTEDEKPFYLYIDGELMNYTPQSSVSIADYNHDYLKEVRIVFDDGKAVDLEKEYLQVSFKKSPDDLLPVECIYKIISKKGKYKIQLDYRAKRKN